MKKVDANAFGHTKSIPLLPDSLEIIGDRAFINCGGTEAYIPANVKEIGYNAFSIPVNVDENNQYYSSQNGVLYNKDKTTLIRVPDTMRSGGNTVYDFTVPDSVT